MSEPNRPIIAAHRGVHADYPENSLGAFSAAYRIGAPWVECDVWASADGVPVVLHDETLDRTTEGTGRVADQPWERLRHLRLRDAKGQLHGCNLPSLQDLIETSGQRGLLVEIKPPDAGRLVRDVIGALRERPRWMVQSFDEENLFHAVAFEVQAPVAFLVEDRQALERGTANGWANIHLRHDLLDESTARRLRAAGVSVGAWTPNAAEDLRRVMDLRADMIITDEPLLAMDLLKRRQH